LQSRPVSSCNQGLSAIANKADFQSSLTVPASLCTCTITHSGLEDAWQQPSSSLPLCTCSCVIGLAYMATLTASLHQFASNMQAEGQGTVLDQFGNLANPLAHYQGTGPEIWQQTKGKVTHFVSSMGTTGTIMGTSRFLKDQKPDVRIIGLQPKEGSAIAGIRRWPKEYLPTIFQVILGCISLNFSAVYVQHRLYLLCA